MIWIYRRYQDVANSAVVKWGTHQKDIMRWIHARDHESLWWRGERLPEDFVAWVDGLDPESLSDHEAAVMFWYVRNRFYFDLGLDRRDDTLLVAYEDLVTDPKAQGERIFRFLGLPFDPASVHDVRSSSVSKQAFPEVRPEIVERAEALSRRLDERRRAEEDGSLMESA